MEIDLNLLDVFKEVVLTGSFSKAALKMRKPKSRVSRQIAALEKEMGVQLIYRTTRQFQLTEAGQELYAKATPLLNELNQVLVGAAGNPQEISGPVRLTAPEDLGVELFGRLAHEFMGLYPKVQLSVHVGNAFVDLVKESIDVAVRIGRVRDSTMVQKKIGSVKTHFIASSDFIKRHGLPTRLAELESLPYLAFSQDHQRRQSVRLVKGKDSRTLKLDGVFASNNFFTLRSMAMLGSGFTIVPDFLSREYLLSGRLVEVLPDWQIEAAPISILTPQQKEPPARVKKLTEFLAQRLQQYI